MTDYAFEPRFTADGKSVIFSTLNGLASVPVDGSAPPKPIPGPRGAVLSADAKLLVYSGEILARLESLCG